MSDVDPSESGLASGVLNTSFMMGGALGLAALASLSEAKGYHAAFAAGALFAAVAAALSFFLDFNGLPKIPSPLSTEGTE